MAPSSSSVAHIRTHRREEGEGKGEPESRSRGERTRQLRSQAEELTLPDVGKRIERTGTADGGGHHEIQEM